MFDGIFVFNTIQVYTPCKNLDYPSKISLISIWIRMVLTQKVTQICKDRFSHLEMPTKYQYLTGITNFDDPDI